MLAHIQLVDQQNLERINIEDLVINHQYSLLFKEIWILLVQRLKPPCLSDHVRLFIQDEVFIRLSINRVPDFAGLPNVVFERKLDKFIFVLGLIFSSLIKSGSLVVGDLGYTPVINKDVIILGTLTLLIIGIPPRLAASERRDRPRFGPHVCPRDCCPRCGPFFSICKFEGEGEWRAMVFFRRRDTPKIDLTIELFNQLLWDNQSEANTFSVHGLGIFDESKKFKELVLVRVGDTNTCVSYFHLQIPMLSFDNNLHVYLHFASFCKLQGVWLQIQKDLHQPRLVSHDMGIIHFRPESLSGIPTVYVQIIGSQIYLLFLSFILLDVYNSIDRLPHVKPNLIFPEAPIFNLRKIKQILDDVAHQRGGTVLLLEADDHILNPILCVLVVWRFDDKSLQLLDQGEVQLILSNDRVEGISHLMGNCGVDKREELVLLLRLVVQDLVCAFNDLQHLHVLWVLLELDEVDLEEMEVAQRQFQIRQVEIDQVWVFLQEKEWQHADVHVLRVIHLQDLVKTEQLSSDSFFTVEFLKYPGSHKLGVVDYLRRLFIISLPHLHRALDRVLLFVNCLPLPRWSHLLSEPLFYPLNKTHCWCWLLRSYLDDMAVQFELVLE